MFTNKQTLISKQKENERKREKVREKTEKERKVIIFSNVHVSFLNCQIKFNFFSNISKNDFKKNTKFSKYQ